MTLKCRAGSIPAPGTFKSLQSFSEDFFYSHLSFVNLKIALFANYYKKRHSSESWNLNINEIPHLHSVSCGMTEWSVANPKELSGFVETQTTEEDCFAKPRKFLF